MSVNATHANGTPMPVDLHRTMGAEAKGAQGNVDRSDMSSVADQLRESGMRNCVEPHEEESKIFGACVALPGPSVPISSPDDEPGPGDETVEAPREHTPTAAIEGNFGESAAVAPQDVSADAEVRADPGATAGPSSGAGDDGGFLIDVGIFVDQPPEGLQFASDEVIATIEQHLAGEDLSPDMKSALEFVRDGFERAMEALQGNAGIDEHAIDNWEKALDAAMAAKEVATDARELDFASEIHELAGNLEGRGPEETAKAVLGVLMSIFALLDLRDGPELRGPTWQGGLAHAVLEPSTPAYAKQKATRILNMAQRYKEIMKQQARAETQGTKPETPEAERPNGDHPPQATGQKEKADSDDARTPTSTRKDEQTTVDGHGRTRRTVNSSDSEGDSDSV
jgi:hypothetical protein